MEVKFYANFLNLVLKEIFQLSSLLMKEGEIVGTPF